MRYSGIIKDDFNNGNGVGVTLFTQGCIHHCKNCHNPETWDLDGGYEWTAEKEDKFMSFLNKPYITRLAISGGDPLLMSRNAELLPLLKRVKTEFPHIKIWLWTGYSFDELNSAQTILLPYIDILVDGRFVEEEKDLTLPYCGSRNQRVIDVQKTLISGEITLYNP